jgi:hypothetical protein
MFNRFTKDKNNNMAISYPFSPAKGYGSAQYFYSSIYHAFTMVPFLSPKTNDRVGLDVIETNFVWKCCGQGVRLIRTSLPGLAGQPNRPPVPVPSIVPAARPAAPGLALSPAPCTAPALLSALPNDANRRHQRKEKLRALAWKPSRPVAKLEQTRGGCTCLMGA